MVMILHLHPLSSNEKVGVKSRQVQHLQCWHHTGESSHSQAFYTGCGLCVCVYVLSSVERGSFVPVQLFPLFFMNTSLLKCNSSQFIIGLVVLLKTENYPLIVFHMDLMSIQIHCWKPNRTQTDFLTAQSVRAITFSSLTLCPSLFVPTLGFALASNQNLIAQCLLIKKKDHTALRRTNLLWLNQQLPKWQIRKMMPIMQWILQSSDKGTSQ